MRREQDSTYPEELAYRDEWTGELRVLDHALDASWGNVVTYERDIEIVATYGMEDPAAAEEL
jgi:hypothetical protein